MESLVGWIAFRAHGAMVRRHSNFRISDNRELNENILSALLELRSMSGFASAVSPETDGVN